MLQAALKTNIQLTATVCLMLFAAQSLELTLALHKNALGFGGRWLSTYHIENGLGEV